jgi:hypothetical protein
MRYLLSLFLSITLLSYSSAQSGTEVYLFDLSNEGESWTLSNPLNVSQNEGYDNQPSFSLDGSILYYTSNRQGETDLVAYQIESGEKQWITETPNRSEYSPTITPDGNYISFITLSKDGVQEFRKTNLETNEETLIEGDPIIGYFVWIDDDSYLCFVLADDVNDATLQLHNISTGSKEILLINPGRSLKKHPYSNSFTVVDNSPDSAVFATYNPRIGILIFGLSELLNGSQDFAYLPNGQILMGLGSTLYTKISDNWELVSDLSEFYITGITRLAINSNGTKIAIVVEE